MILNSVGFVSVSSPIAARFRVSASPPGSMMTDPIADLLTRLRNAARAKKTQLSLPASRVKWEIAKILEREGFLERVDRVDRPRPELMIVLRYVGGAPAIRDISRVSKPGRRSYVGWEDIPSIKSGYGLAIISTSQGIMTGEEARRRRLGGEFMAEVS